MHYIGYEDALNELYLPLMHSTVNDCLIDDRKKRQQQKYLWASGERARLVEAAAEGMLNGIAHLHAHAIFHRDVKMDNLLLRVPPNSPAFDMECVVISDYGYSLCNDINPTSSYDMPGTHPYQPPELLSLRLQRQKGVRQLLRKAQGSPNGHADRITLLVKNNRLAKDHANYVSDLDVIATLKELGGDAWYRDLASGCTALTDFFVRVDALDVQKLDIYSSAVTCWLLFHPNCPEPLAEVLGGTENHRVKLLEQGRRPSLTDRPTVSADSTPLWDQLVGDSFFSCGWDSEPEERPTAQEYLHLFRRARHRAQLPLLIEAPPPPDEHRTQEY